VHGQASDTCLGAWERVESLEYIIIANEGVLCAVLGAGGGVKRRRVKPVGPAGEVSCETRGRRSPNDASSEPRGPVLKGVWACLERLLEVVVVRDA
jgi:hypothetical protein